MDFSGRLSAFPMADLLQWAMNERCTGVLVVRRSHREKRVLFRRGEVVGCHSDDTAEYFGRHLVLQGHLGLKEITFALRYCHQRSVRLGVALRELGLLSEGQIREALRQHIEDSVCDIFLWRRGVFFFTEQDWPEEELSPDPLDSIGLTLEGARWLDEYQKIRGIFQHDNIVLHRGLAKLARRDSALQRLVYQEVDGEKSLSKLHSVVQGSYFRFLEATFDLAMREIVDIEETGGATEREASREIGIYDLLMEQATEEQNQLFQRRMALPADLLEGFYPFWIRSPRAADLEEYDSAVAALLQELDGNVSIVELLDRFDGPEEKLTEALGAQLRGRLLALLPRPAEEIALLAEDSEVGAGEILSRLPPSLR